MENMLTESVTLADVPEVADLLVGRTPLVISSWSMYPALSRGDQVTVASLNGRLPQVSDMLVFRRGELWICHRVVEIHGADTEHVAIITRGDASAANDAPVPLNAIIGRVTHVTAGSGLPRRWHPLAARWWHLTRAWKRMLITAITWSRSAWLVRRLQRLILRSWRGRLVIGRPVHAASRFLEWQDVRQGMLADRDHFTMGFARGNDMLARADIRCVAGEWEISDVHVRFRYQGCGIGRQLVAGIRTLARAAHVYCVVARIPQQSVVCAYVERLGFWQLTRDEEQRHIYVHTGVRRYTSTRQTTAHSIYHPGSQHTDEEEFLCQSVRQDASAALTRLDALAAMPLDWQWILGQARVHHVASLLFDRLHRLPMGVVSPTILKALRTRYYQDTALNTRLFAHVEPLVQEMQRTGIPCVALSGYLLAQMYYHDPALRPMGDVDLLVAHDALAMADAWLTARGYQRQPSTQYVYMGHGILLELHPPEEYYYYDMQALLASARQHDTQIYQIPTREDLLIFLLLHMTVHHVWLRLIWLSDIARVIVHESCSMRWDVVIERLQRHPGRTAVYHALCAVQNICGVAVPDDVLQVCAPCTDNQQRAQSFQRLLTHAPMERAGLWVMDVVYPGTGHAVGKLMRRFVPGRRAMQQRYRPTGHVSSGHYLARWLRLLRGGCGMVWTMLSWRWTDRRMRR